MHFPNIGRMFNRSGDTIEAKSFPTFPTNPVVSTGANQIKFGFIREDDSLTLINGQIRLLFGPFNAFFFHIRRQ
jgi:hypothetical protein